MDPAKLKVVDLRAQLSQRGLDSKGNKAVLVERLRKALEEESESSNKKEIPNTEEDEILDEKPIQTPKTPARSSRSSSMTPTKISTRSTPKHPTTPISKQNIQNKPQSIEKVAKDLLNTIPEKEEKQPIVEEEQTICLSEKSEPKEEWSEEGSMPVKEEVSFAEEMKEKQEDKKEEQSDNTEVSKNLQILEVTEVAEDIKSDTDECNKLDQSTNESYNRQIDSEEKLNSPEKSTEVSNSQKNDEDQHDLFTKQEENKDENMVETVQENTEQPVESIQKDIEGTQENENEKQETGTLDEVKAGTQESVKVTNTDETEKISQNFARTETEEANVKEDDQKLEPSELEHKEDSSKEELSMDTKEELSIDMKETNDYQSMEVQEEQSEESNIKDHATTQDALDTEMAESKPKEGENKKELKSEQIDRKRKRSPSPVPEDQVTLSYTSSASIEENEPELDDSTVLLSWYDSDLNLDIKRDNFLSAVPLHTDGFCYIWAGVRASHGFTGGKIYYEVKIIEKCSIESQEERDDESLHSLRVGWSVSQSSLQLGEEKLSYGYDTTGKKCTENTFEDYGPQFSVNDIVGCYADLTPENDVILSYTVNGKDLGAAFLVSKEELGDKALFPHILSRNCVFSCNFGQEDPWSEETLKEFTAIGNVEPSFRIPGPRRPEKNKDCEVLMMCGLPGAGKTFWATRYASQHPEKMYNILGLSIVANKMKNMGQPRKQNYPLIDKCTRTLNKLLEMACSRRRNYILDQTNVYPSAQRRKMKNFSGYQRKAIVVVPTDEEYKLRVSKHEAIDGKAVPDSTIMEMKANFSAPEVGEFFEEVQWIELQEEEGKKLIEKYNKEGAETGAAQSQANKRPRYEKSAENSKSSRDSRSSRDSSRDSRDSRDHRDRRSSNYSDRNRSSSWRSNNNMGRWRDKPSRGHMRHGGGYGPPGGWRGRNMPIPPLHRGSDRRGGTVDRRGNDRVRSTGQRQGGRGPASSYQGSQSGWNQGGNWSNSSQSQGSWGQGSWGQQQQWGNWKGYGQGAYGQSNYNLQAYGNGNWNSWNQQYYNQYWNQQQQTGQTTAAGGQAVSTTQNEIETTPANAEMNYDYSEGWQGYDQQTYPSYSSENTSGSIQSHRHK